MKTRVKPARQPILPLDLVFASLLTLALVACGPAEGPEADASPSKDTIAEAVEARGGEDCLLLVWARQDGRSDASDAFDRENDGAHGGAISCATGTSASRFEAVLARLRDAATRGDKAALLEEMGIPLLYIDEVGNRRLLEGEALDVAFDEAFPPEVLAELAEIRLEDMTVVTGEGGFFRLGALWLVVEEPGGEPRLVSVNRQALGEAAAAAAGTPDG